MLAAWLGTAMAGPVDTRDALERVGELIELRLDDGQLVREELLPAIIVSTKPRFEETADWYETEALNTLTTAFGPGSLRLCQACMAPRATAVGGTMAYQTGPIGIDEVVRLDENHRGDSLPARTAIWLDETEDGVSVRIVDLRTSGILYARNVDPMLNEYRLSRRSHTLAAELDRRARGGTLTQTLVDLAVYPNPHVSLEWADQWGKTNANLSGFSLSLFEPVAGIGVVHYRAMPFANILLGGKLHVSLPNVIVRSFDTGGNGDLGLGDQLGPLLTLTGVVRVPFGNSNYAGLLTVNTNGRIGLGITLLNINLIPVIL